MTILPGPNPTDAPCEYPNGGLSDWELYGEATASGNVVTVLKPGGDAGTAIAYVDPCKAGLTITFDAQGTVETLDPGYDWVNIKANGEQLLYIESTQDEDECGYESKSDSVTYTVPEGQACPISIEISGAPNDGICNDSVQWDVTVTIA